MGKVKLEGRKVKLRGRMWELGGGKVKLRDKKVKLTRKRKINDKMAAFRILRKASKEAFATANAIIQNN